jgi:hypothetical protein
MSKSHIAVLSLTVMAALTSCVGISERTVEEVAHAAPDHAAASVLARMDLARGRRWELGWGAVAAYDVSTNRPIRRIALEGAPSTEARGTCRPDMVLDRTGALLVSSNTQPVLWRVSPERFEVERFEIRLEDERGRDVGFSGLAWAADGRSLYALDSSTRTPWKIDLVELKARRVGVAGEAPHAC